MWLRPLREVNKTSQRTLHSCWTRRAIIIIVSTVILEYQTIHPMNHEPMKAVQAPSIANIKLKNI